MFYLLKGDYIPRSFGWVASRFRFSMWVTYEKRIAVETIWGFPKIRCTIMGVTIIRIIVFWGPY